MFFIDTIELEYIDGHFRNISNSNQGYALHKRRVFSFSLRWDKESRAGLIKRYARCGAYRVCEKLVFAHHPEYFNIENDEAERLP